MYLPGYFQETDTARLHQFIRENSFGILVSSLGGIPFATHVPMLIDEVNSCLLGHVAKANEHGDHFNGEVLGIFHGPHAYISPTWYGESNRVPTWNYVAVHVYGTISKIEDRKELTDLLERMVEFYETPQPKPWRMNTLSPEFIDKMLDAITGFRVQISRIEGKWKLNQNRLVQARQNVADALSMSPHETERQIAALMKSQLGPI